jgi:hypothetical protein
MAIQMLAQVGHAKGNYVREKNHSKHVLAPLVFSKKKKKWLMDGDIAVICGLSLRGGESWV